ncbi:hypothetical protein [Saccharothrix variisporea]|uniref:Uncharacterized protein n=1 Tax=Saccharothrix variisporea TaxID=543527 RepID=A0A495XC19_9PSEU|nr:hypothetical protein [Saccharothrix variisporea]RKT72051.1 hypothetical protein DFJ66_5355 [Saccharothrix variisporea]
MNDLDAQRPEPVQQMPEEERAEREEPAVPRQLSGLEWLVKQVQRQREG